MDFKVGVKTSEELLQWIVENIEFGYIGAGNKRYSGILEIPKRIKNGYTLLLPDEVYLHRIGTCWEKALFAKRVFEQELNIPCECAAIHRMPHIIHTYLVFQREDKWFHFESSFHEYFGVWGGYDDLAVIPAILYEKLEAANPIGLGYTWKIIDTSNLYKKYTVAEFLSVCGYEIDINVTH